MLVSGMIIGTMFTLFVVPSIYMLVAKRHVAEVEDLKQVEEEKEMEPADAVA